MSRWALADGCAPVAGRTPCVHGHDSHSVVGCPLRHEVDVNGRHTIVTDEPITLGAARSVGSTLWPPTATSLSPKEPVHRSSVSSELGRVLQTSTLPSGGGSSGSMW